MASVFYLRVIRSNDLAVKEIGVPFHFCGPTNIFAGLRSFYIIFVVDINTLCCLMIFTRKRKHTEKWYIS